MARREFEFVLPMRQYSRFNKEQENNDLLLRAYPDL
jgi:hypothetical protein